MKNNNNNVDQIAAGEENTLQMFPSVFSLRSRFEIELGEVV